MTDAESGSSERLHAGTSVGPYRLVRELGQGGQGKVFLADDSRIARKVALKLLPLSSEISEEIVEQFRREAEITAKLDHPGICTVYEADYAGDLYYIAMRYVRGKSLEEEIAQVRAKVVRGLSQVDHHAVCECIESVARILHVAHEAGLVHRDMKPSNIMVTKRGPVILDFGIARDLRHYSASIESIAEGYLPGTPAYMSPEQIRGDEIDRLTDVYSLGVVLYECLCLQLPFEPTAKEVLFKRILNTAPLDPQRINPRISGDLGLVLLTAMAKSSRHRYQTALEFAADLRRVRHYEAVAARPPARWAQVKRATKRHPVVTAALVLAVLLFFALAVCNVLLYRQLLEERSQRQALETGGGPRDTPEARSTDTPGEGEDAPTE